MPTEHHRLLAALDIARDVQGAHKRHDTRCAWCDEDWPCEAITLANVLLEHFDGDTFVSRSDPEMENK